MREGDIIELIEKDKWMMSILKTAQSLNLPDWMIGAGFVRNKIWDYLHGFKNEKVPTSDIDLIYYDKSNPDEEADRKLSQKMKEKTGIPWEIVNQAYTHKWHNTDPYTDTTDALADWVEIATCVAVSLSKDNTLKIHAPHGIDDLINLIVRRNEKCSDGDSYEDRVTSGKWKENWPKLIIK